MNAIWAHVRLLLDIWSIKIFVSLLGRDGELLDSHLFFFDRYSELAEYHRLSGRLVKAERLEAIAEAHYQAAPGDDEPPEAAAGAMPVPQSANQHECREHDPRKSAAVGPLGEPRAIAFELGWRMVSPNRRAVAPQSASSSDSSSRLCLES